jgi:hypothetical protein
MYSSKESQRNLHSRMKGICLWSHITLNREINVNMHSSSPTLIAYELIHHNTQISQLYHHTQTHYESETQMKSEDKHDMYS